MKLKTSEVCHNPNIFLTTLPDTDTNNIDVLDYNVQENMHNMVQDATSISKPSKRLPLTMLHYSKLSTWILQLFCLVVFFINYNQHKLKCDTNLNVYNNETCIDNDHNGCVCIGIIKDECKIFLDVQCEQFCQCDGLLAVYVVKDFLIGLFAVKAAHEIIRFIVVWGIYRMNKKDRNKKNQVVYGYYHCAITTIGDSPCIRLLNFSFCSDVTSILMIQLYNKKILFEHNQCGKYLWFMEIICDIIILAFIVGYSSLLVIEQYDYLMFIISVLVSVSCLVSICVMIWYCLCKKKYIDENHELLFYDTFSYPADDKYIETEKKRDAEAAKDTSGIY
eukprot:333391_1